MAGTGRDKRVLVFSYSQSGQLTAIVDRILAPMLEDGRIDLRIVPVRPLTPHPFPWPVWRFFDVFPETALMLPEPLAPLELEGLDEVDLIVLPYQVWFLAPSRPMASLLADPEVRRLLAGRPVVTLTACRNMWLMAHTRMREALEAAGARLLDHIVFTDPSPMAASLVTTPLWMFTGRREGWFGLPPAGIDAAQIQGARRFGQALSDALAHDQERGPGPLLGGLRAACAEPARWASERAGTRSFRLWGRLIHAVGPPGSPQRWPLLALYVLVLLCLIILVLPFNTAWQALRRPWRAQSLGELKAQLEAPSGSGSERMSLYES